MQAFNIHDAKTNFSKLIAFVLAGEEIIIAKAGQPLVKMVPVVQNKQFRFGTYKEKVEVPDDFDAPLPEDLLEAFYGDSQRVKAKKTTKKSAPKK